MLDSEPDGQPILLVAELRRARGRWRIRVEQANVTAEYALRPTTVVIRLWRSADGRLLRGRLQVAGSDSWAPFQSNDELRHMLGSWLAGEQQ